MNPSPIKIVRHVTGGMSLAIKEIRVAQQLRYTESILDSVKGMRIRYEPSIEPLITDIPATYVFHRCTDLEAVTRVVSAIHDSGSKVICDYDDLLCDIPEYNPCTTERVTPETLGKILEKFDLVTVATEFLKEKFKEISPKAKIMVIKNRVPKWMTMVRGVKRNKKLIIYTGSSSHHTNGLGDWTQAWVDAIKTLCEKEKYTFLCMTRSLPEFLQGIENIKHIPMVPLVEHYYRKVSIPYGVEISPLLENDFNRSKSAIRAIETAAVGASFVGTGFKNSPYNDFCYTVPPDAGAEKIVYAIKKAQTARLEKDMIIEDHSTAQDWFLALARAWDAKEKPEESK